MSTNPSQELVHDIYAHDLHIIAKNFCENAKNTSEILLNNKEIEEPSTSLLKEFKNSLNDFLRDYPLIKHYDLYELSLATFIKMAGGHGDLDMEKPDEEYLESDEKENDLKREKEQQFKQMFKQYFADTFKEYENSHKELIKSILPKLQDLKQNLEKENIFKFYKFSAKLNNLENCKHYTCFPINHYDFVKILPKTSNVFTKYKKSNIENLLTLILIAIDNASNDILEQEEKLSQLSLNCRVDFTNDLKSFITKFENSKNIEMFLENFDLRQIYFLKKYYNNREYLEKDRDILNDILERYLDDDAEFNSEYELAKSIVIFKLTFK